MSFSGSRTEWHVSTPLLSKKRDDHWGLPFLIIRDCNPLGFEFWSMIWPLTWGFMSDFKLYYGVLKSMGAVWMCLDAGISCAEPHTHGWFPHLWFLVLRWIQWLIGSPRRSNVGISRMLVRWFFLQFPGSNFLGVQAAFLGVKPPDRFQKSVFIHSCQSFQFIWGFPNMGDPNSWMVDFRENPF